MAVPGHILRLCMSFVYEPVASNSQNLLPEPEDVL